MINTTNKIIPLDKKFCPIRDVMGVLGGKWAFPIVYTLMKGKMRFTEIERNIIGINTRMLVKELKSMEKHQIVERKAFATVPPTVEYSLTAKGEKLKPILLEMYNWANEYEQLP
jgi:DNA-binding HxlR family transcriptional regulator